MVETAIVLPLIIFLIIIIIETALLANAKSVLRYATFCAVRNASVHDNKLKELPKTIFNLKKIKQIDCRNNELEKMGYYSKNLKL